MFWLFVTTIASLQQVPRQPVAALDRVLAFRPPGIAGRPAEYDRGASAVWQLLEKLQTTGSVLHTTAHPDDEHVGLLTRLSRGEGIRTSLLALNRGEGGANAIGPELFDALGIIRTEELRLAGSYYGLDDLYFTTAVDYGYSKTLAEAEASWDMDALLGDMVRVLRLNRPLVVVSRFHGSSRDGHGHHQAAGALTPRAVRAAADPRRFPDQITLEGLRPWQVRKLYRGGVRRDDVHHVVVDAGEYSPWLGSTYEAVGRYGVSLQRSQTAGRLRASRGPAPYRYERLFPDGGSSLEAGLFEGLDTSPAGILDLTGESGTVDDRRWLRELQTAIDHAARVFTIEDPARSVPPLMTALRVVRGLLATLDRAPEARFLLSIKQEQIRRTISAALGLDVVAHASDAVTGIVTPDSPIEVDLSVTARRGLPVTVDSVVFSGATPVTATPVSGSLTGAVGGTHLTATFRITARGDRMSVPYFTRATVSDNRYAVRDSSDLHLPVSRTALTATLWLDVDGTVLRSRRRSAPRRHVYREDTRIRRSRYSRRCRSPWSHGCPSCRGTQHSIAPSRSR